MAKSQYEITDRLSNCSVCFEPYEEKGDHLPRILPCLHTFCERCIKELLDGNVFHCPDCKVPHPVEDGAETFKPNKYVLSHIERTAMAATDSGEIHKMVISKVENVRSIFDEKELKLRTFKEDMINTNKVCLDELETRKKEILKMVTGTFDEMIKELKTMTTSETQVMDEKLQEIYGFKGHLDHLQRKIDKNTKTSRDDCVVELEKLKNMAELPVKMYQYCEYHPDYVEDYDEEKIKRMCGYLSTKQQESKGKFKINIGGFRWDVVAGETANNTLQELQ